MSNKNIVGHLLKHEREKKQLSLQDISTRTKINLNILKSLEDNDLARLPNKAYVKGFVINYARTIGLDENVALESYYASFDIAPVTKASYTVKPEMKHTIIMNEGPQWHLIRQQCIELMHKFTEKKVIFSLVASISLVVVGKVVYNFLMQVNQEKTELATTVHPTIKNQDQSLFDIEATKKMQAEALLQEALSNNENEKEKAPENKVTTQVTEKVVPVAPKNEAAPSALPALEKSKPVEKLEKAEGIKQEKKPELSVEVKNTEEPKRTISSKYPHIKFSKLTSEKFELDGNASELKNEDIFPARYKNSMVADKQNVFVSAVDGDTWISYQADDQKIKRYILLQGKSVMIRGDKVQLFLGNVNVTRIFYNNQLMKIKSKSGVKSLVFPEKLANNMQVPLFPSYNGALISGEEYRANMEEAPSEPIN